MRKISAFILLTALMLTSCASDTEQYSGTSGQTSGITERASRDLFAMDTFMTMTAYGENSEQALSAASEKILSLESIFSVTDENSEIWKANHSGGHETDVSRETSEIISFALDIAEKTSGALNPAIYPVVKEWGFTTGDYHIPDAETLRELLENTDYSRISVTENSVTVPEGMLIDLGAAAKGFTGDAVSEIMKDYGVESAVFSLGGNIQTVGSKPDGSDWRVSVRDPFDENSQMCIVSVSDKAVVTSGNYERFFTGSDGKQYCHIIDPSDGYPAENGLVSVTIVSESGTLCDCLSTAMFVKGEDAAVDYWRENGGFEMILADSSGELTVTEGLENCLEVINGMEMRIVRK